MKNFIGAVMGMTIALLFCTGFAFQVPMPVQPRIDHFVELHDMIESVDELKEVQEILRKMKPCEVTKGIDYVWRKA